MSDKGMLSRMEMQQLELEADYKLLNSGKLSPEGRKQVELDIRWRKSYLRDPKPYTYDFEK